TCNKTDLCNAITHVLKAVSAKSPVPVMEGICVQLQPGQIVLTGYNLEIGIRTAVVADCEEEFTFVLNARLFSEMTRRMSGEEITLEIDDALNASLSSENTRYQLSAMSAEEFPELPVVETMTKSAVSQQLLRSMIQESSFAASVKEDKPILTGELFESSEGIFYIVAMDRYRLALRQEAIPEMEDFHFVVPKKALSELISMLKDDAEQPCEFFTNGKHIVFAVNGFELFARLLEGQFHNFRSSIPSDAKTNVVLNKRDIFACAERCSLLINDKNKAPMRCVFADGSLEISCKTGIGAVNDRIPAEIIGDSLTIGFSNKYLLEALRSCQCDKLRFQMSGSNKVIKITPVDDESFIYLIMPIQLKN
ncbi:MAG: DNA polymerase III subunit beta, partial [Oscillospiraceae bacterium]|nr:DNA polymerase III subunit beta [Oscillospiraceae bacterium]